MFLGSKGKFISNSPSSDTGFKVPTETIFLYVRFLQDVRFFLDFCLVIKFQPYLETLQSFFSRTVSENTIFSLSKLAVKPKIGGHVGAAKTA